MAIKTTTLNLQINTVFAPLVINGIDVASVNPTFPHVSEEDLISPKVELQTRRAMSVFLALEEIKKEQGEDIFDNHIAKYIRDVEELQRIEDHLPPSITQSKPDNNVRTIKFDRLKGYQKVAISFRNQLWIPRLILELLNRPKKLDLKKVLKTTQEHLGLSDSELPRTIKLNDEKFMEEYPDAAACYHMANDEFHLLTNGFEYFKRGTKKYHPSIKYWFDLLPKTIKDGLSNVFDENIIEFFTCHELVHKRQAVMVQRLTLSEAKAIIEAFITGLNSDVKKFMILIAKIIANDTEDAIRKKYFEDEELMNKDLIEEFLIRLPKFKTETDQDMSEEEYKVCKNLLFAQAIDLVNDFIRPGRDTQEGMRRYNASPFEIEARMETEAFMIEKSFQKFQEIKDLSTSKNIYNLRLALRRFKEFLVDRVINGILLRITKMKIRQVAKEEIDKEEAKIKALKKLTRITSTVEYLGDEDRLGRGEAVKKSV